MRKVYIILILVSSILSISQAANPNYKQYFACGYIEADNEAHIDTAYNYCVVYASTSVKNTFYKTVGYEHPFRLDIYCYFNANNENLFNRLKDGIQAYIDNSKTKKARIVIAPIYDMDAIPGLAIPNVPSEIITK